MRFRSRGRNRWIGGLARFGVRVIRGFRSRLARRSLRKRKFKSIARY